MGVGILLLSHCGAGQALIAAARGVVGPLPLRVASHEFHMGDDSEQYFLTAGRMLRDLDGGVGVLVLVDLYGSTPSNVAARLASQGTQMRRVSGVNLPMLLRVLNYAELDLDALPAVAATGGRNGVLLDDA